MKSSRSPRVLPEPLPDPRVRIGGAGHVGDDGDRVGAGGENLGGLLELDAADRDEGNVADALLPFGDLAMPCGAKRIDFSVVGKIGPSAT